MLIDIQIHYNIGKITYPNIPILTKLAKAILSCFATLMPRERNFSKTGIMINCKQNVKTCHFEYNFNIK